jgi:hypothetical protein
MKIFNLQLPEEHKIYFGFLFLPSLPAPSQKMEREEWLLVKDCFAL